MRKKWAAFLMMLMMLITIAVTAGADNAQQIRKQSGSNPASGLNSDGVRFSKSISATEWENYFDITLQVTTSEKIEQLYIPQDASVVLVVDVSATMREENRGNDGKTRYDSAMAACETFIKGFQKISAGTSASRKIGAVAFGTSGTEIFGLSTCKTTAQATALIDELKRETKAILYANGYESSGERYTNMEAGIGMANSMLAGQQNKYIVFLSDGRPTTYSKTTGGAVGYSPLMPGLTLTNDKIGKDGYFYNQKANTWVGTDYWVGTNYSDKAATRAQNIAQTARNNGTTIFAVGTSLPTGSISSMCYGGSAYTIDCYENGDFVIGNTLAEFKSWMTNKIASGSGYYYDANNASSLASAFSSILEDIKTNSMTASEASWAVEDPMNTGTVNIEFKGLYNKAGQFVGSGLTGAGSVNGENTANYANGTLQWNLKNSGYKQRTSGNTTYFDYEIKYRVRLQNERSGFVEHSAIDTNGTTELTYQVRKDSQISDPKKLSVPVPQVEGYLAELTFAKKSAQQAGGQINLQGAEFTLTHAADCPVCKAAQGSLVAITAKKATSNAGGEVKFTGIPSGHSYTLQETKAPAGHEADKTVYKVTVAYDVLTGNTVPASGVVNVQKIEPTAWQPVAIKYVDGTKTTVADEFSFTLIDHQDNDKAYTVKNDAQGEVVFPEFEYDKPGVYTYTIKENKGSNPFVQYDTTEFKVTVTVEGGNVGSGANPGVYKLEVKSIEVTGGSETTAIFSNIHLKDIKLKKWSGDFAEAMKDAEFTLSHAPDCCDEEIASVVSTTGSDGILTFAKMQVTHAYVLEETGTPQNYLNPDKEWRITFERVGHDTYNLKVNGGNGTKDELEVVTSANGTDTLELKMVNTEKYVKTVFEIEAGKTLDGFDVEDEEFSFNVYRAAALPVATGSTFDLDAYLSGQTATEVTKIGTAVNVNALITFEGTQTQNAAGDPDKLEFTHKDIGKTFYYLFTESDVEESRKITGDQTVYGVSLTVTVPQGESNTQQSLTCTKEYFVLEADGKTKALSAMPVFDNTSRVDIKLIKFDPADVRLNGAEFTLKHDTQSEDSACYGCSENIPLISSEEISGGLYRLDDLFVGHDYLLTETKAPHNHLRPDKPWKVRVTATGYKQYQLELRSSEPGGISISQGTADYDNPTFELEIHDPLKYPGIKHRFSAKKMLDGSAPHEIYKFKFELRQAEELPVSGKNFKLKQYVRNTTLIETVINTRGAVDFVTEFAYTHHDIYEETGKEFYFLIREVQNGNYSIEMDASVYLAIVRIQAIGGDDFTPGELVPWVEFYKIKENGKLSKKLYEVNNPEGGRDTVPVFQNFHSPDSQPQTGDRSRLMLYVLLLAVSVIGMAILERKRRFDR